MGSRDLFCVIAFTVVYVTSAVASGHHISCQFKGSSEQQSQKLAVNRTLFFYLDDTGLQLVPENGGAFPVFARTTLYSDTEIQAEISDVTLAGSNFSLFGILLASPANLRIERTSGVASIAAKFLPTGAEFDGGTCQEVTPPPTKF